jgi:hypothetical protein
MEVMGSEIRDSLCALPCGMAIARESRTSRTK